MIHRAKGRQEYKIVFAGDSSVGKTSIMNRLYSGEFSEITSSTVSPGIIRTKINLPNVAIPVCIWDTAGQEKFHCMVPIYARNANGLILVFDLSASETFHGVKQWYESLREVITTTCQILLCGNKDDLKTDFDVVQADQWARSKNIPFVKVSAKSGFNVQELFQTVVQMIYDQETEAITESKSLDEILRPDEKSNEGKFNDCC